MSINKKVLIIDNEHEFSSRLQNMIEQRNYEVLVVDNKTQAQEILHGKDIGLVILGTITPRTDMLYIYKWFKQNPDYQRVPLIIINEPGEPQLSLGWDINDDTGLPEDCFFKPIEPDKILHLIIKQMDRTLKKIKVLLVDDQEIVREGIRIILNQHEDIEVIGEARHGKDAIEKAIKLMPDVILMDIVMPGMNGLEATRQILQAWREARVLVLSQYDNEESIRASHKSGACGFLSKSSLTANLVSNVRTANRKDHMK
jgi:DNA-binding NarL/FixJ family response regulator